MLAAELTTAALTRVTKMIEAFLFPENRRERRRVEAMLVMMKGILEDAEHKQSESQAARGLVNDLYEVVWDAEDVLDEIDLLTREKKSPLRNLIPRVHTALELTNVGRRLNDAAEWANLSGVRRAPGDGVPKSKSTPRPTTSGFFPFPDYLVSRGAEKGKIMDWLLFSGEEDYCADTNSKNLSVFSIVGVGGIGKTALAQSVYNDGKMRAHFSQMMWVCASNDLDISKITREMIGLCSDPRGVQDSGNFDSLTLLQKTLASVVSGHRFLLVLDDVWDVDYSDWNTLLAPLRVGRNGSKVLVTTRSKKIAVMVMAGEEPLRLGRLSDEDAWSITKSVAFANSSQYSDKDLEEIGKQIVEKLGGSPLAAKTIGRLLQGNRDAEYWRSILTSGIRELLGQEDFSSTFVTVLKTSYERLTATSKLCFDYCSLFPTAHRFCKDELVLLWMAQGFINSADEGERHLQELLSCSLFESYMDEKAGTSASINEESIYEKKDTYMMHVLVHCLAVYVSQNYCVMVDEGFNIPEEMLSARIPESVRHLSWALGIDRKSRLDVLSKYGKLRTLLFLNQDRQRSPYASDFDGFLDKCVFQKLKRLQVLGLQHCPVKLLPPSVGSLKHLRYVNLSQSSIKQLPRSLGKLWNLQVLNLAGCCNLEKLPHSIRNLTNLRVLNLSQTPIEEVTKYVCKISNLQVLNLSGCFKLRRLPEEISNLTNLKCLDLRLTDIRDLPKSLGNLHSLQMLNLEQCDSLTEIRDVTKLVNLRHLFVDRRVFSANAEGLHGIVKKGTELHPVIHVTSKEEPSQAELPQVTCIGSEEIKAEFPVSSGPPDSDIAEEGMERIHSDEAYRSEGQGREKPHEGVDILSKNGQEKLGGGASSLSKETRELKLQAGEESVTEEWGTQRSHTSQSHLGDVITSGDLNSTGQEGLKRVPEGERYTSQELHGEKQHESIVSQRKMKGKGKLREGGISISKDEGLKSVPEGESTSDQEGLKRVSEGERYLVQELQGEKLDEGIVPHLKMKGKDKLQEGGISGFEDENKMMVGEDEEFVRKEVGNEQNDPAIQTHLSNEFAHHHCFKPPISEELRNNIDSLVNVQGMEDTLSTIKKHLKNDEVDVIKIHGVGGVGKTTILKKLCEDLHTEQEFDFKVVIMVTASKYFQHNMKMQKDIGEQLGLSLFARGPSFLQDKQANILCHALSEKMPCLLLLDGAREIEWEKIGIPPPKKEHGCKIIIATDEIKDMENMEIVKVSSLDEDESKKLFLGIVQEKVVINNQQMKDHLADKVFHICNGLPLALIVVGQAMSFNREAEGWLDDIDKLDGLAKDLHGGEQGVHCAIKFSYDKLKDDTLRFCLLYCSLFPEYHNISVEEIIQYWFGEGLLHDDDIDGARKKGHDVIRQLKAVSLLEDGRDIGNEVKMHDVIRDVALQLTSNSYGQSNLFIVHAGSDSKHAPEDKEWRQATRVSLMYSKVEALPCKILKCPDLSTLLINNNMSLKQIPRNFFKHMPALRVLDLSSTGINKLPRAIGLLTMLQFLNLSKTCIISLPEELGKLLQLRQLDLSYMPSLSNIPRKAILKLSKLQALNLYGTTQWCIQELGHGKQKGACIQDLENLVQLKDLRLTITSVSPLQKLQSCPNLLKSSRLLGLDQIQDLSTDLISDIFEKLENLQVLQIAEASCLKELQFLKNCLQSLGFLSLENLSQTTFIVKASFQKLRHLHIIGCHGFKDLLWACRLPFLECLELRVCYGIEVLITDNERVKEEVISTFPMLKTMLLLDLPMLERISSSSLSLPSLEYLEVFYCPKLKKLPLTSQSAKKINEICGRKEWWDGLEWDLESVKMNLLHLFKDLRNHKEMTVKYY